MVYVLTGCFIVLDFITGIIKALKNKEFCSSVMREGLFHKAGVIIVVAMGVLVDYAQMFMDLGFSIPIAIPICVYISLMEIGSVIENLYLINEKIIPSKLQEFFKKINDHKSNDANTDRKDDTNEDVQSPKE